MIQQPYVAAAAAATSQCVGAGASPITRGSCVHTKDSYLVSLVSLPFLAGAGATGATAPAVAALPVYYLNPP